MKTLITQAMQQRRLIRFIYNNKARTVEPHVLGVMEDQREALLGWQLVPPTLNTDRWQVFDLDNISGLRMIDQPMDLPPEGRDAPTKDFSATYFVL